MGKLTEINAAFGLVQLKHINESIEKRKVIDSFYRESFKNIPGIKCLEYPARIRNNYSYFVISVENNYPSSRDELLQLLAKKNIIARRYFYPLISDYGYYSSLESANPNNLPIAKEISNKVLCLPIYSNLDLVIQEEIIGIIRNGSLCVYE